MKLKQLSVHGIAFALGALIAACGNCGTPPVTTEDQDGGDLLVEEDGGDQGNTPDANDDDSETPDSGPSCAAEGESCASLGCCEGFCGADQTCVKNVFCKNPSEPCQSPSECCSGTCNGYCGSERCKDIGIACTDGSECCTRTCGDDGGCQALPGQICGVLGSSCDAGVQCCSSNCRGGQCTPAYSCQAYYDLCSKNADCCSGLCTVNDGGVGTCVDPSGGCNQGGNPCSKGTTCCSRICGDPGSGAKVCLAATGCRLTGDSCETDNACCGGGVNPNGTVDCTLENRCDQGNACIANGLVCGESVLPDGGSVNAQQDCCDGKKDVCKLDSSGIPRCFGGKSLNCPTGYTGESPCCIGQDQVCQFKDQCCNGLPCLPGVDGILRCTAPTCIPVGNECNPDGGGLTCCLGDCRPSTEIGFVCHALADGGVCKPNDADCSSGSECCSMLCQSVAGGGRKCIQPQACQQLGATCTNSADCCTSLFCDIPGGASTGTCKQGTCPQPGQQCSDVTPCCTGLQCWNASNNLCQPGEACSCAVVIN